MIKQQEEERICQICLEEAGKKVEVIIITHRGIEVFECPEGHRVPRKMRQPIGWGK